MSALAPRRGSPRVGLGMVVPHDMVLDRELWRWTPDGVSLFFSRTRHRTGERTAALIEQISGTDAVVRTTEDLLTTESMAYAYVCTSCSFVRGIDGEKALVRAMEDAGAPLAITTSGALLDALQHLGARRVVAVTPYNDELTARFVEFLRAGQIDVVHHSNLGLTEGIPDVRPAAVADLIRAADHPDADAVCVACTNLPTYDVIAPVEEELGKPVVTANQATMWMLLRQTGRVTDDSGQRLFQEGAMSA